MEEPVFTQGSCPKAVGTGTDPADHMSRRFGADAALKASHRFLAIALILLVRHAQAESSDLFLSLSERFFSFVYQSQSAPFYGNVKGKRFESVSHL